MLVIYQQWTGQTLFITCPRPYRYYFLYARVLPSPIISSFVQINECNTVPDLVYMSSFPDRIPIRRFGWNLTHNLKFDQMAFSFWAFKFFCNTGKMKRRGERTANIIK